MCLLMVYALGSWLPKLMMAAGYSLGNSLMFLMAMNIGAVIGTISGGILADRFHLKPVIIGMFLLGAFSLVGLGFNSPQPVIYLLVGLAGASAIGSSILLYSFVAQYYPLTIRSTGIGCASAVGRVGAIVGPIIIGVLLGMNLPHKMNFLAVAIPAVIGAIAATTIGVVGYHLIHNFNKIGTWLMGGSLLIGLLIMLPQINAEVLAKGSFNLKGWFAMFGLCAVWQISFSPYTSDYSRYLPKSIGIFKPFIFTYLGASLGTIFAMLFGTVAVSIGSGTDAMEAVKSGTGIFGSILMILFLCNIIGHNAMNLYGAVLSCITSIQTFAGQWIPSKNVRIILSIMVLILATFTALWASSNFISFFLNVIFALLFILVPWVSINLLDFYVINKKSYDIQSIFAQDGGIYGKFNGKALTAYFIGIVVQIPFLTNAFFTGPFANVIQDVDISWVIGLVVSFVVYYFLNLEKIKCSSPALNVKVQH